MKGGTKHIPVMLDEAIGWLEIRPRGTYIDATAGFGGHASRIIEKLNEKGELILIDRDEEALENVRGKFRNIANISFYHDDFRNIGSTAHSSSYPVMGVLFDLGVSTYQLDTASRGFSFREEGPLDMRMDRSNELTAEHVVNTYNLADLSKVISEYGEEKFADRIARAIVRKRPISNTKQLADLIADTVPVKGRIHPATRTFQALRIEVNDELASVEEGLRGAIKLLARGGRLVVITFHSLEERVVKKVMNAAKVAGELAILTPKPIAPSFAEIKANPRARSARMRVGERL